jgi:hypothetical protein
MRHIGHLVLQFRHLVLHALLDLARLLPDKVLQQLSPPRQ